MEERQSIRDFMDCSRLPFPNNCIHRTNEIQLDLTNHVHRLELAVWLIGLAIANIIVGIGLTVG